MTAAPTSGTRTGEAPRTTHPHPDRPAEPARWRGAEPFDLDRRLALLANAVRWSTICLGILVGVTKQPTSASFLFAGSALVAHAVLRTVRRYRLEPPDRAVRLAVVVELLLTILATAVTGGLGSPFVLTPVVPLVLGGYAWGDRQILAVTITGLGVTVAVVIIQRADPASQRSAATLGVAFLLAGVLGAFTRRLVHEISERHAAAVDQVARMATANELLVALHGLAQTLPSSLDLGEVVESTRSRLRSLFDYTSAVVLVVDEAGHGWRVEMAEGVRLPRLLEPEAVPLPLYDAHDAFRPRVAHDLVVDGGPGCAPDARSGLYAALRARGDVVGLLAVEHREPGRYDAHDVDLLANVTGPFALAVDNARWFARLRSFGAEAERARIARELHDRLAQSLVYVGFELDRLTGVAGPGDEQEELGALRDVVREMVGDLRETLYQLRANVTEDLPLERVARDYVERFERRTGIRVDWSASSTARLPLQVEQEVWRILQEALTNVERHAAATCVRVRWTSEPRRAALEVADDGHGFQPRLVGGDHYGLLGMHERADAIGARLEVRSEPGAGTRVLVELEVPR